jgi:hypothetical protein
MEPLTFILLLIVMLLLGIIIGMKSKVRAIPNQLPSPEPKIKISTSSPNNFFKDVLVIMFIVIIALIYMNGILATMP